MVIALSYISYYVTFCAGVIILQEAKTLRLSKIASDFLKIVILYKPGIRKLV